MSLEDKKQIEFLVVDTTAFIQNAPVYEVADNILTCKEVVNEITSKRQLRRLVVLPYDLTVKDVFPENIKFVSDFSKKTGDFPSLSATDIKVIALTYQLEKEKVGVEHLHTLPVLQKPIVVSEHNVNIAPDVTGFFLPGKDSRNMKDTENLAQSISERDCQVVNDTSVAERFGRLELDNKVSEEDDLISAEEEYEMEEDNDNGWINPSNVKAAQKQVNSQLIVKKQVVVACMTTDFAMQNVLRQMNLNVSALDGRIIKQLRTYILRCYTCFKTTSIMTKTFCPKCGNNTLKKVAVSLDENGKMQIHINSKRPLTAWGKKFSLPRIKGGKHPNNPILVEDQPTADNRPSRLTRTKNNPLDDDYIAGFSPFVTRDVNSKSAQLGVKTSSEFKYWMRKNPNEARRKRK